MRATFWLMGIIYLFSCLTLGAVVPSGTRPDKALTTSDNFIESAGDIVSVQSTRHSSIGVTSARITASSATLKYSYLNSAPNLCDQHLATYLPTLAAFSELSPYLHLIPYLDGGRPQACSRECPLCHQATLLADFKIDILELSVCSICGKVSNGRRWALCKAPLRNSGYFQERNRLYFRFFEHFLHYCSENQECQCYWPQLQGIAAAINQSLVGLGSFLEGHYVLDDNFSPHWPENFFYKGESLATYAFFFSQYHQILLDLAEYADMAAHYKDVAYSVAGIDKIYQVLDHIKEHYLKLYSECLEKHPHPKIFYERGMVYMKAGDFEAALKDIRTLMELADNDQYRDQCLVTSEMYHQEGSAYADLGMYDKAIEALNKAILKDTNNLDAYFQRAAAYFEEGNFDCALKDFLVSKKSERMSLGRPPSLEFLDAFTAAAARGCYDSACEFVPSLCYTAHGLGKCLWTFGEKPVDSVRELAAAAQEIAAQVVTYLKTVDKETLHEYADELVKLHQNYRQLSDKERGEMIGYVVGKYGVEIFSGVALTKGVTAYKKLKQVNHICNLRSMTLSSASRASITKEAVSHNAEIRTYLDKIRIHRGHQNNRAFS